MCTSCVLLEAAHSRPSNTTQMSVVGVSRMCGFFIRFVHSSTLFESHTCACVLRHTRRYSKTRFEGGCSVGVVCEWNGTEINTIMKISNKKNIHGVHTSSHRTRLYLCIHTYDFDGAEAFAAGKSSVSSPIHLKCTAFAWPVSTNRHIKQYRRAEVVVKGWGAGWPISGSVASAVPFFSLLHCPVLRPCWILYSPSSCMRSTLER